MTREWTVDGERTPWRVGRKLGRTIYKQVGVEPSDDDPLIGMMDTAGAAELVVRCVNRHIEELR